MTELWERLKTRPVGRPRRFESPQQLLDECFKYFQWNKKNPLYESRPFKMSETVNSDGLITRSEKIVLKKVPRMRAMTIGALCTHLEIDEDTWDNYRSKEGYEDFFGVTKEVERIIRAQKFEGASADLLNANIIARDLGLAEKTDNKHEGISVNIKNYQLEDK